MDDGLAVRTQGGDETAFAVIATECAPRLHRIAYRILRDVALAEDAVQQTLLRARQDLAHLRDRARFVVLHHYLGMPMSDVADAVGAPLETVRARLRRAERSLRAALEAEALTGTDRPLHSKVPA